VDGLRKQAFRIRVAGSEFSEKIPLDNVGDVGIVQCPAKDQMYRVN
jgi:hypothetical protein